MRLKKSSVRVVLILVASLLLSGLALIANVFAQETTGGLQGTVKDASGAVVAKASVVLTGSSLGGSKSLETDSSGYYRFANLPPGTYTVIVEASGFSELKREGITVEVGHLPTLDLTLAVGAAGTVVEVNGEAPVIDVTTNTNQTNVTQDVINDVPHGYSFQSVIQFSPMARNEPLMGATAGMTGNSGGSLPGSNGNGQAVGFSVGGDRIRRTSIWWRGRTPKTSLVGLPVQTSPSSSFRKSRLRVQASRRSMAALWAAWSTS